MNQEAIKNKLVSRFGEAVVTEVAQFRDQVTATVVKEKLHEVCTYLKDDPELAFDFLSFVAGVDRYPDTPRFEVVYQLNSLRHHHRFRIKTVLEEPEEGLPVVVSVTEIWPTANWHERETAEMYGIVFDGHPDPRKLLMPDDWAVHPLRKDFPLMGTEEDTPDLSRTRTGKAEETIP